MTETIKQALSKYLDVFNSKVQKVTRFGTYETRKMVSKVKLTLMNEKVLKLELL